MDRLVYTAMSGLRSQMSAQATIANNIANASTTGYRAERVNFDRLVLQGTGFESRELASEEVNDFDRRAGTMVQTGRPLDMEGPRPGPRGRPGHGALEGRIAQGAGRKRGSGAEESPALAAGRHLQPVASPRGLGPEPGDRTLGFLGGGPRPPLHLDPAEARLWRIGRERQRRHRNRGGPALPGRPEGTPPARIRQAVEGAVAHRPDPFQAQHPEGGAQAHRRRLPESTSA